jgi:POT family proton-dependent oligopeptide transporter
MSIDLIRNQGTWFGHPKALFLLFTTEMWERFSYYAMRAILVLYLTDKTIGMGWTDASALELYGIFTMSVYLTPLVGGWLADQFLGQRKSILIGGFLMAMGQFLLGTPHAWIPGQEANVFYAGLILLVIGNGLFKPNISTMVGDLYEEGDHRRDGAFTIFYMGINLGAFLSGIIVGSVVEAFGGNWQAGFVCAGIGMVLSLIVQIVFAKKLLGPIGVEPAAVKSKRISQSTKFEPLTKVEIDRLKVIFIMGVFTIIFWAGFEQAGGLMNIYTQKFTDRTIDAFNWTVPTTWFQSLNPFFIFTFAPLFAWFWSRLGDKEPSSPVKFGFGLFLLGVGFLFMIGAVLEQGGNPDVKTSMGWLVGAYFFHTMGELCLSPIGLSMVTKLAPLRLASVLMGVWFVFTGLANYVAGLVGSMVGGAHGTASESEMINNAMSIFGGIAITAVFSAIIMWALSGTLIRWMHGAEGAHHDKSVEEALKEELEGSENL